MNIKRVLIFLILGISIVSLTIKKQNKIEILISTIKSDTIFTSRDLMDSNPVYVFVSNFELNHFDKKYVNELLEMLNDTTYCSFRLSDQISVFPKLDTPIYRFSTVQLETGALIEGIRKRRYPYYHFSYYLIDTNRKDIALLVPSYKAELENFLKEIK